MDRPILHTKLYIPPAVPGELIARPRLTQRLNETLTRKLTLISAPAGYGKTTLVSQWLSNLRFIPQEYPFGMISDLRSGDDKTVNPPKASKIQNPEVAWVSLDEGDNDPVRFWIYVIAALETVQSDVGTGALFLLQSPQPSPLEAVLTFLLNDLAALSHHVVLILDDYHFIENPEIHTSLIFFLDRLPAQIQLIITSRVDPPLPLARWRVRRQLAELRAEDLGFTLDEASLFFSQLMGLDLSVDNVAALEAKTEGWIAGLQLAALSLQGRSDVQNFIATFTGNHRYILDYITEEVLHRQPPSIQTFLLQTAILERLSGPLCDAVTGRSDSQTVLEQLARANLFTIPLDEQGQWYRYHHLFSDLLRHHLQQAMHAQSPAFMEESPEEIAGGRHRRAAAWYEQAGLIEEAVQYALLAQDFEHVGHLIVQHAPLIIDRGGASLLLRWFKALPEPWVQSQPKLGLLQAWLLFLTGHLEEVQRQLEIFEKILNPSPIAAQRIDGEGEVKDQAPGLLAGLQAQIALIKGDIPGTIELSQQALAYLMADEVGPQGIILQNLALAYWISGEAEKAQRILAKLGAGVPYNNDVATLISLSHMAELKRMQGRDREAFSLYQQFLPLIAEKEQLALSPLAGLAYAELGHLLYEWNDLAAAETHLRQGVKLGNQGAGFRPLTLGYIGLFRVYLAQENFDKAVEIIHQMEQLAAKMEIGPLSQVTTHMRVDLWLAQDNGQAVEQWLQTNTMTVKDELDNRNVFAYTLFAQALLYRGRWPEAAALLPRLLALEEAAKHTIRIIEILAWQAVALQAQNKLTQAVATLQRALSLAEAEGYIRIFINKGAPMAALLQETIVREADEEIKAYSLKLLAAFEQDEERKRQAEKELMPPSSAPMEERTVLPQPLIEPLTRRELEVLQLLTTGLSGQEIADKLVITRSTLKAHIRRIYDKLGVKSRAQVVVKSKELRLI